MTEFEIAQATLRQLGDIHDALLELAAGQRRVIELAEAADRDLRELVANSSVNPVARLFLGRR